MCACLDSDQTTEAVPNGGLIQARRKQAFQCANDTATNRASIYMYMVLSQFVLVDMHQEWY